LETLAAQPNLQPRLNFAGQRAEVGDPLHFVVGQFHMKVVLQAGQQIERLQTVDAQILKKSRRRD